MQIVTTFITINLARCHYYRVRNSEYFQVKAHSSPFSARPKSVVNVVDAHLFALVCSIYATIWLCRNRDRGPLGQCGNARCSNVLRVICLICECQKKPSRDRIHTVPSFPHVTMQTTQSTVASRFIRTTLNALTNLCLRAGIRTENSTARVRCLCV